MNQIGRLFGRINVRCQFKNVAVRLGMAHNQNVERAVPNGAGSFYYSNSTKSLLTVPTTTRGESQEPMIYEEEILSPSESEQELLRIQSMVHTGSEEAYNKALNELNDATEKLKLLQASGEAQQEDTVKAMKDVAFIQWELGLLEEAQSTQEEILSKLISIYSSDSRKGTDPPTHMEIASTMHSIGSIQSRMNNPVEAKKWFDASLNMKEELLINFTHHFEIGKTLNGLALVQMQLDEKNGGESDPFDVIQMLNEAENHYIYHGTKQHGSEEGETKEDFADHPQVASINENIATLYRKHGDLKMALGRYENALRIYRQRHYESSDFHTTSREQIMNLLIDCGDCLSGLGKYDEALNRYEEALKLHISVVRHQRKQESKSIYSNFEVDPKSAAVVTPLVGVLKHNIGMMNAYLGNYEDSMSEYLNALSVKKKFGEDHYQVGITYNAIGAMQGAKGDTDSAMNYFEKALDIFRMHTSVVDDEDQDENIYCTKKNIEKLQKTAGGSGGRPDVRGRSRGYNF
mmetsp:Transcript_3797/g.7272  ORF Transcript_3797/g.7272 Transcript_3797/m.7272 type:complete len:518 (+) Transcript_3797:60-1613(+)